MRCLEFVCWFVWGCDASMNQQCCRRKFRLVCLRPTCSRHSLLLLQLIFTSSNRCLLLVNLQFYFLKTQVRGDGFHLEILRHPGRGRRRTVELSSTGLDSNVCAVVMSLTAPGCSIGSRLSCQLTPSANTLKIPKTTFVYTLP